MPVVNHVKKEEIHENVVASLEKKYGHTKNPLATFSHYPLRANFVAADSKEKIILILRRHPITNLSWAVIATLMLFAPLLTLFFPVLNFLPERFQIIAMMGWYLVTMAFVLEEFLSWFFSVYIITDERIFDVDFVHLVYREIAEANLEQIQDVTVIMGGAIRTILNYGNILIQTASETPQIEFEAVPKPDEVARILRDLRVEEEVEKLEGRVR